MAEMSNYLAGKRFAFTLPNHEHMALGSVDRALLSVYIRQHGGEVIDILTTLPESAVLEVYLVVNDHVSCTGEFAEWRSRKHFSGDRSVLMVTKRWVESKVEFDERGRSRSYVPPTERESKPASEPPQPTGPKTRYDRLMGLDVFDELGEA